VIKTVDLTCAAKKVEYHFTKKLPEATTARQKSELILECSLSEEKPGVIWRINDAIIEVHTTVLLSS